MKDLDIKTAKAYQFKLALQRLWLVKDLVAARFYRNKWCYWATHSKIVIAQYLVEKKSKVLNRAISKEGMKSGRKKVA